MSDRTNPRMPEDKDGIDAPHDVLAADEFAVPGRSAGEIPSDPIHKPHDVLAAEEFAIPGAGAGSSSGGLDPRTLLPSLLLVATILLLVRRHRRHG